MTHPYYDDGTVTLYVGDCREILPALDVQADLVVTDPPYGETSLAWDRWPTGWPALAATAARSMWCFGSMRMFLDRREEFTDWKLSQDVIWHKNAGSGPVVDRPSRVHEHALHWYRGPWKDIHHEVPRVPAPPTLSARPIVGGTEVRRRVSPQHRGHYERGVWIDGDTRLLTSVLFAKNLRGLAIHPTEKPVHGLLEHLITYACPPGGLVLDLFAGSGSTLEAARLTGRRAIGIEANEQYAEAAARRLAQAALEIP